jgi:hypothetical protein
MSDTNIELECRAKGVHQRARKCCDENAAIKHETIKLAQLPDK